jgi:hypothetical protein
MQLRVTTRKRHEIDCQFNTQVACRLVNVRPTPSDVLPCEWTGDFSLYSQHLAESHQLQGEVGFRVTKLSFADVLSDDFYSSARLMLLQDLGVTVLVNLTRKLRNYAIIVRILEFSCCPRTATVSMAKGSQQISYSRTIYGMQMRSVRPTSFLVSYKDFRLLSTERALSFTLAVSDTALELAN